MAKTNENLIVVTISSIFIARDTEMVKLLVFAQSLSFEWQFGSHFSLLLFATFFKKAYILVMLYDRITEFPRLILSKLPPFYFPFPTCYLITLHFLYNCIVSLTISSHLAFQW